MAAVGGGEGEARCRISDASSIEQLFECREVPTWGEQLTARAFVVSLVLGFFLSFIVMKLNLTTGIIPSFNVSAGLLGFFFVKTWTKILDKSGFLKQPFTRQENTVIQTCVVACSGIAFSGGFGSYILGMSKNVSTDFGEEDNELNTKDPQIGWMIAFLFTVSFIGLFSVVPLRKIMILSYKLTYPSGTATAHLINSFHTSQGALLAKRQVSFLFKSLGGSFLWSFFQWFYTGGSDCGFGSFPTFGLEAYKNRFYFDFSTTYIGVGMICPYMINVSLLLGSVISWGILWPYISTKKGVWYDSKLHDSSLQGLNGYKVFISIAMILGDGLFHFLAVLSRCSYDVYTKCSPSRDVSPFTDQPLYESTVTSFDDRRRAKVYRGIAALGVHGFSTLPRNCLSFCFAFFLAAMAINGIREVARHKKWRFHSYVPSAMGMAVPFYLGSYFTIDMCVGSLILLLWEKRDKRQADAFAPAVAAGLICGDGIWSLPASLLAIAKVKPPICMKFLSWSDNFKLEALISHPSASF
ncbi:hypothetical protein HPP92_005148 [Vanilla planifolia]|uniref:Metal-nicotianamine transporter YSL7 n=1 Tax=Vanilla planifolia TaxID=51239 RepID=A0A835VB28_VANPL|nr:hypothetical protein HPP92_005148 [Vanilla planifolia]